MFIALSKFVVANGMTDAVKKAFVERPHMVDDTDGYIKMDVISPLKNPDEIWLITYWTEEEKFKAWHKGHTYKSSHGNIPKGLKLVPGAQEITFFEHICS